MIFASDNWSGASDKIVSAVADAARSSSPAYGGDDLTRAMEARFCDLFEREVDVVTVATGTAANALAIAAFGGPGGIVFCHADSHIVHDEAGAVSFFGDGLVAKALDGAAGKIEAATLRSALDGYPDDFIHAGRPMVASIAQLTEWGAAYRPDEIASISAVTREQGMAVHMDGARFAAAVAGTGASPADLTWRADVDVLSFGGTKNGCLMAEAVVLFNPDRQRDLTYARQRAGHGLSKNWFAAAQFLAYLDDDHWLDLAGRANAGAAGVAAALQAAGASLVVEPDGNEVFAFVTPAQEAALNQGGVRFYRWPGSIALQEEGTDRFCVRLVASFRTEQAEVDRFGEVLATAGR